MDCFVGALFFLPLKSSVIFFILSTGTGFLLGYQFPLLAEHNRAAGVNSSAGHIYSLDLFGGWLAAILAGTVLIPAGGFFAAIVFFCVDESGKFFLVDEK